MIMCKQNRNYGNVQIINLIICMLLSLVFISCSDDKKDVDTEDVKPIALSQTSWERTNTIGLVCLECPVPIEFHSLYFHNNTFVYGGYTFELVQDSEEVLDYKNWSIQGNYTYHHPYVYLVANNFEKELEITDKGLLLHIQPTDTFLTTADNFFLHERTILLLQDN